MSGLADRVAAYREAEATLTQARADLHAAIRAEHATGTTAYRIAQMTGLDQTGIGRIIKADRSNA